MSTTKESTLLSPELLAQLERLELVTRKVFRGRMKGERRSRRKGQSVEFADFRNYVPGDDLRFIDWNLYARLDKLFLKLFLEEEDLHVSVLLDISKSMDWGKPVTKGLYVKRLAAALAYIGLVNYDRVSVYGYNDTLAHEMKAIRGRRYAAQLMTFLDEIPMEGGSNFSEVARRFASRNTGKGVVVILSDFMDKSGYEDGMRYLVGRNYDIYMIHVLSPQEIDPTLVGDLKLRDVEDDDLAEVTISKALLDRYKANLTSFCMDLKDYCNRREITYLFTNTRVEFDVLVMSYLRQQGLLR